MAKKKEHIIASEMVNEDGSWTPAAKKIALDADEILKPFVEKHKGKLSLCAIHNIVALSIDHQIRMARLNSIKFD